MAIRQDYYDPLARADIEAEVLEQRLRQSRVEAEMAADHMLRRSRIEAEIAAQETAIIRALAQA
jgi:hypothetical protein